VAARGRRDEPALRHGLVRSDFPAIKSNLEGSRRLPASQKFAKPIFFSAFARRLGFNHPKGQR
jgi:hypothetical protein